MYIILWLLTCLVAACILILVLHITHVALKRYGNIARYGRIREGLALATCSFAVLATISVGAIFAAGRACQMDYPRVESVDHGSVAASAGFSSGDLITHVNGSAVTNLRSVVSWFSAGQDLTLSIARGPETIELTLPAAALDAGPIPEMYAFGLHFPILTSPLTLGEAIGQWASVARWIFGSAVGITAQVPWFLVGLRLQDNLTFLLAYMSFLALIVAPLFLHCLRRPLSWAAAPIAEPIAERDPLKRGAYA